MNAKIVFGRKWLRFSLFGGLVEFANWIFAKWPVCAT
jgi:hypothetical protein